MRLLGIRLRPDHDIAHHNLDAGPARPRPRLRRILDHQRREGGRRNDVLDAFNAGEFAGPPHVHMIVPGGGLSLDGANPPRFPPAGARALSRLFRRLVLAGLVAAHAAGRLAFFGDLAGLKDARAFGAYLAPLRRKDWFVYAKPPFAGPKSVLAYLSRYSHRVAIAKSRLIAATDAGVTFHVKDYRLSDGRRPSAERYSKPKSR